jgi:hypothetical protein
MYRSSAPQHHALRHTNFIYCCQQGGGTPLTTRRPFTWPGRQQPPYLRRVFFARLIHSPATAHLKAPLRAADYRPGRDSGHQISPLCRGPWRASVAYPRRWGFPLHAAALQCPAVPPGAGGEDPALKRVATPALSPIPVRVYAAVRASRRPPDASTNTSRRASATATSSYAALAAGRLSVMMICSMSCQSGPVSMISSRSSISSNRTNAGAIFLAFIVVAKDGHKVVAS